MKDDGWDENTAADALLTMNDEDTGYNVVDKGKFMVFYNGN